MADDKMLREMTSDPKFRKVLVTDGKTAVGQAMVQALVKAGADIVWVGHAEPWKKLPGFEDITALPQVTLVPLDLTDERSVTELAGEIGGKVDIVINNAEVHRAFGIAARRGTDVAARRDGHQLLRPAAPGAGVRPGAARARSADGVTHAAAWVNLLSIYALANFPPHGTFSASKAAALFAGAVPARRDAPGRHPRDQRVPGADRRRMEPEPAAAQGRARGAGQRDREGAAATASRTCTRATWRRNGWSAGATTPRCWNANSRREAAEMTTIATPSVLAGLVAGAGQRPHPRRRPDADADARVPADRAAARDGPVLAVPHRGDLALRRARPGLVLEQLLLRRAHRHALRRADPLDLRPRPAEQLGRHDPGAALRRAGLRDRLLRAGRSRTRTTC